MKSTTIIPAHPKLKDRRAALEAKVDELTAVFQDRSQLAVQPAADVLDTIRVLTDRDVVVQRMNMSARVLAEVRDAIAAIDRGEYGICEECDQPIAPKRLDAIPWARLCVPCQEGRDSRRADADFDDFSVAA